MTNNFRNVNMKAKMAMKHRADSIFTESEGTVNDIDFNPVEINIQFVEKGFSRTQVNIVFEVVVHQKNGSTIVNKDKLEVNLDERNLLWLIEDSSGQRVVKPGDYEIKSLKFNKTIPLSELISCGHAVSHKWLFKKSIKIV